MAPRAWGYWTEAKLDILSAYLPAFATASKRAATVIYLDLFAGNEKNRRRDKPVDIKGSAIRALEALPPSARIELFELPRVAASLENRIRQSFPERTFSIIAGDVNATLEGVLRSLQNAGLGGQPAFAFIDPYSSSALRWSVLEQLADFKRHRKYKTELWLLFYGSDIPRRIGAGSGATPQQLTRTFGCEAWVPIARARDAGRIDAARARNEYTNLLRWRLVSVLGYQRTHTLEIKNTSGSYLYDLIFATDNAAGDRIMRDDYRKALARNEQMRREAAELRRAARSGQDSLFGADEVARLMAPENVEYEPEPPAPPFVDRHRDD